MDTKLKHPLNTECVLNIENVRLKILVDKTDAVVTDGLPASGHGRVCRRHPAPACLHGDFLLSERNSAHQRSQSDHSVEQRGHCDHSRRDHPQYAPGDQRRRLGRAEVSDNPDQTEGLQGSVFFIARDLSS